MLEHTELLAQGEVLSRESGAANDGGTEDEIERLDKSHDGPPWEIT